MSLPARARTVVLPIATLGEVLVHGFEVHVWCPRCHQFRRPTIPAERLSHRFAGARFRCRCGAPGYPSFRPGPHAEKRQGDMITDLYCPHCLPPWEMLDVRLGFEQGQSWTCPGCRRPILMHTRKEPASAAPFSPWEHLSPTSSGRK
jgi:transposase-like protein